MSLKKVMLVDSKESMFHGKLDLLDREVLEVIPVSSGAEALRLHREQKVDVIVVGHDLPDMTPIEFCKNVRSDEDIRVVSIIAGMKTPQDMAIKRIKDAGANVCVKSPIDIDEFMPALARLLSIPLRQAIRIMVRLTLDAENASDFFIASSVNLSETGLLVECDRVLDLDKLVTASFYLPSESGFNKITVDAVVVRTESGSFENQFRYGMEFRDFTEGTPSMIHSYVQDKKS